MRFYGKKSIHKKGALDSTPEIKVAGNFKREDFSDNESTLKFDRSEIIRQML